MDRPEHGGLSGATLEEAISWGKVSKTGKSVVVVSDVTVVFPLSTCPHKIIISSGCMYIF